jgi:hypothetical protein
MDSITTAADPMAAVMARIEASARAAAFRTRKWIARDFRADPRRLDKLRPGLSHETPHDMIAALRDVAATVRRRERAARFSGGHGLLGDLRGRGDVGAAMIYARWLRRYAAAMTEAA